MKEKIKVNFNIFEQFYIVVSNIYLKKMRLDEIYAKKNVILT
jgi:hypothetical protein